MPPDFLEGSAKAIAGLPKIGLQIQSGMKLHYRFRKTTGAGEHETEIVMSVGGAWVEANGLAIVRGRFVDIALASQGIGQVIVC